jgi:hypothetical protein
MPMLKNLKRALSDIDSDDVLERIGLERHRSTTDKMVPALALFGAGVLVGVGLGLMLAPKPGAQLRGDLQQGLRRAQTKIGMRDENGAESEAKATASVAPVRPA